MNYTHYNSEEFGFTFEYPKEWLIAKNEGLHGIQLFPDGAKERASYQDNLSLFVRPQSNNVTGRIETLGFIANELIKSNFNSFQNHVLLSLTNNITCSVPSREIHFCFQNKESESLMLCLQIVFVIKGKLFLISFISREPTYNGHLSELKFLIDSIVVE